MIKQFDEEHGVNALRWGMTETSPLATANIKTKEMEELPKEELYKLQTKQGKPVFGVELKIMTMMVINFLKMETRVMIRGP